MQDAQLCDRYKLSVDLVHEFYPNPRPWTIFSEANHCPAEITASQIYPPIKIQLYPPKSVENQVDKCFKITSFAYLPAEVAIVHRHRFANAQNGRAWADYYTVAFLTSSNQLIFAYSCGSSPIIAASQKLPPPLQIPGTVAFLSVRWGSTYFHWMTDLLPRIELLRLSGIDLAKIDKFVVESLPVASFLMKKPP
ncbi:MULTISPECIES: hypothetical protein [Planktothricoides]|uniref:Uncharacterized protein n=2 Tax=Planktothricoides raciborskii TaxID=132608 RepID=A0AAU8J9V4_9CYAN|nr:MULTISPECIES: hypothetical protein [Planktothricoides]MBD2547086.1 hypothetical protein [Planktothricoides raciborskii FACHB-1370]MBD2585426.1 hypothetical protein [Planktothricoides raciborskii FACHB-1261]